jgi:transitional endoplasmic reticulum ATPase
MKNDVDNNNDNIATLRVAETLPKFVGRGIGLIDPKAMEDLNLSPGDVVDIASRRKSSYVLLWS